MLILRMAGKARQVFPLLQMLIKHHGHHTLGDIIEEKTIAGVVKNEHTKSN